MKVEDEKNRIHIPIAADQHVDWLGNARKDAEKQNKKKIFTAFAPMDDATGVDILPHSPDEDELATTISQLEQRASMSDADRRQLYRLKRGRWIVEFEVQSTAYRLKLPSQARKLKLLPDYPGVVVIDAFENQLEMWTDTSWLDNLPECKVLLSDLIDEFLSDVAEEEDST